MSLLDPIFQNETDPAAIAALQAAVTSQQAITAAHDAELAALAAQLAELGDGGPGSPGPAGPPGPPGPAGNQYLAEPDASHAWDDEFVDGSPDLAVRGWTVKNANTGATLTRAGDVTPHQIPNLETSGTYRSTLTKSGLVVQAHDLVAVSKAVPAGPFSFFANVYLGQVGRDGDCEWNSWLWENGSGWRSPTDRGVLLSHTENHHTFKMGIGPAWQGVFQIAHPWHVAVIQDWNPSTATWRWTRLDVQTMRVFSSAEHPGPQSHGQTAVAAAGVEFMCKNPTSHTGLGGSAPGAWTTLRALRLMPYRSFCGLGL